MLVHDLTDRGTGPEADAMMPLRRTTLTVPPPTRDASAPGSTAETDWGSLRAEGSFRSTTRGYRLTPTRRVSE